MKLGQTQARSQRQLRVGEVIRHALAGLLEREELRDPGLKDVSVTVTEVRISPDLRNATVFVMPLGGIDTADVIESLSRATPFFRRRIAQTISLRRSPELFFELDVSFENARQFDMLLKSPAVASDVEDQTNEDGP